MKKICIQCHELYEGSFSFDYCPKVGCGLSHELRKVDDLMIGPLIHCWSVGIDIIKSCAGHLYRIDSHPCVVFYAHGSEEDDDEYLKKLSKRKILELKVVREELLKLNVKDRISIDDITEYESGFAFTIRPNIDVYFGFGPNSGYRERLRIQYDFLGIIYDLVDHLFEIDFISEGFAKNYFNSEKQVADPES